ncbi:MAG TPA: sulfatase/phosphatase domain-containing protein, partial [Gemmataceae bacterium]
ATCYAILSHLDEQIGRILAALKETGQFENTLILFTSDHGLALGSHGLLGKQNMYEHTVNVPLILHGPGVPRGKRFAAQCYLRDLFPTACDLAGVAVPDTVQGKSLVPVLRGEAKEVYPFVAGYFTDTQRMIREGDWKLVRYPRAGRTQLFDLKRDPDERTDLSGEPEHAGRVRRMLELLGGWLEGAGDTVPLVPVRPAEP